MGKGGFGQVFLAKAKTQNDANSEVKLPEGRLFAIKAISKKRLKTSYTEAKHTRAEKHALSESSHPFIVEFFCSFQSKSRIFFVMEFLAGGELFALLQRNERLPESSVR